MSSPYTGAHHEQVEQVPTLPLSVFFHGSSKWPSFVLLVTVSFLAGSLLQAGSGLSNALSQLKNTPFLGTWRKKPANLGRPAAVKVFIYRGTTYDVITRHCIALCIILLEAIS